MPLILLLTKKRRSSLHVFLLLAARHASATPANSGSRCGVQRKMTHNSVPEMSQVPGAMWSTVGGQLTEAPMVIRAGE